MFKKFFVYSQYLVPQHALTKCFGYFAGNKNFKFKNFFINQFIKRYKVDLSASEIENPEQFETFNDFFTRKIKVNLRPIAETGYVASPVDGIIAEFGEITEGKLLQAKQFYFDLSSLTGNDVLADRFQNGSYATLYLAPYHYHRIHMPLDGKLVKTIYIPGKLFSVNNSSMNYIPQLYSRNERLISLFETEIGLMAVIMVGAMIVGSMQTVWMAEGTRGKVKTTTEFKGQIYLRKGEELGLFKVGSTVIVLFESKKIVWERMERGQELLFGQAIGKVL